MSVKMFRIVVQDWQWMTGFGTVFTGRVEEGSVRVGDQIVVADRQPAPTFNHDAIFRSLFGLEFMSKMRQDHEPPDAIAKRGWRYHHLGIPTTVPRENEQHLSHLKMHVSGFDTSPYGIEWMRFDLDSPISDLVKTVPHIAFEVDDLDVAIVGQTLLGEINSPSEGVKVAMIIDNGVPIELLEFRKTIDNC